MASSTPHTILLKGLPIQKERIAAAAITPGHLLEITSTGLVQKVATGKADTAPRVALESAQIGDTIDTAYAADDTVPFAHLAGGEEIYAWLADGENVAIGAQLEIADGGELQAVTDGVAMFTALEAVNNSAGGAAARIKVEVNR